MNKNTTLNLSWVREQFPALEGNEVFMDNAGGSQTLKTVMHRITDYLTHYDVQLGASYGTSQAAEEKLNQSKKTLQKWINAAHVNEVMIGSSTTLLLRILSLCISQNWQVGDEVIITNCDHEANMAPWRDLQKIGIKVKTWQLNPKTYQFDIQDLAKLMSNKTKLVALTHVSNILGSINPIKKITTFIHQHDALVCVDGVAYAPHRSLDVQDLDVDFYVFSTYKTFGPHQAIMYGKLHLFESMNGINHPFIESVPYKFQPGNVNYELSYSLAAIPKYIAQLGGNDQQKGYELIAEYEQCLTQRLLAYLNENNNISIIGETSSDTALRVATVSFVHNRLKSDEIVTQIDAHNIGIRFGDFYAVELIDDLNLRQYNGVVRISLVHYNSPEEVDKLIEIFHSIL